MKIASLLSAAVLACGLTATSALASTVTIALEGEIINFIGSDFTPRTDGVEIGTTYRMEFSFDENAPPRVSGRDNSSYDISALSVTFSTGEAITGAPDQPYINVRDIPPGSQDGDNILILAEANETGVLAVIVLLLEFGGTLFDSRSLSEIIEIAESGDLSGFSALDFLVFLEADSSTPVTSQFGTCLDQNACNLRGNITSIERVYVSAVPLPASALMLLAGLGGLGLAARRRSTRPAA